MHWHSLTTVLVWRSKFPRACWPSRRTAMLYMRSWMMGATKTMGHQSTAELISTTEEHFVQKILSRNINYDHLCSCNSWIPIQDQSIAFCSQVPNSANWPIGKLLRKDLVDEASKKPRWCRCHRCSCQHFVHPISCGQRSSLPRAFLQNSCCWYRLTNVLDDNERRKIDAGSCRPQQGLPDAFCQNSWLLEALS